MLEQNFADFIDPHIGKPIASEEAIKILMKFHQIQERQGIFFVFPEFKKFEGLVILDLISEDMIEMRGLDKKEEKVWCCCLRWSTGQRLPMK